MLLARFIVLAAVSILLGRRRQPAPTIIPASRCGSSFRSRPRGPTDVFARLLAQKLSAKLGQQFFVENQAGAGGNLGMGNAARAAADGYSVVFVSTSFIVNPSLFAKIPYDPYKDFAPVTLAAVSPNLLSVHPSIPAKTVKELVAFLKANPGKYSFASAGLGTTPHLSGELFKLSQSSIWCTSRSAARRPAIQSALAGHTPIAFTVITPAVPAGQGRHASRARRDHAEALARAARRADLGGGRPPRSGSRHDAGHPRAGGHAEGDHRPPASRDRRCDGAAGHQGRRWCRSDSRPSPARPRNSPRASATEIPKWGKVIRDANIKTE